MVKIFFALTELWMLILYCILYCMSNHHMYIFSSCFCVSIWMICCSSTQFFFIVPLIYNRANSNNDESHKNILETIETFQWWLGNNYIDEVSGWMKIFIWSVELTWVSLSPKWLILPLKRLMRTLSFNNIT